jgi:CBS domain-containing protein
MFVAEIMSSPAITVRDGASAYAALRLLARRRFSLLPVVNARNRLVGVVSEADLLGLPEPPDPRAQLRQVSSVATQPAPLSVADVMSRSPHTTSEHADVAEVAALFHRTGWKCLPVMRGQEVVGVVSRSDIIQALGRDDDEVEADVNRLLHDLEPGWEAMVDQGVVTLTGPGPDRQADAAASLAATVVGVRGIRVEGSHANRPRRPTDSPPAWTAASRGVPPSGGTAVEEL